MRSRPDLLPTADFGVDPRRAAVFFPVVLRLDGFRDVVLRAVCFFTPPVVRRPASGRLVAVFLPLRGEPVPVEVAVFFGGGSVGVAVALRAGGVFARMALRSGGGCARSERVALRPETGRPVPAAF